MINDYEHVLRDYGVVPGTLTNEELRMLRDGGIPLDEDIHEEYAPNPHERVTQPRLPRVQNSVET